MAVTHDLEQAVWDALREIPDPEIPTISIVDLGIINQVTVAGGEVTIEATPTFVGCPALTVIGRQVQERVGALAGVTGVKVNWVMDPPWTTDRITEQGRRRLREFGIAPPGRTGRDLLELEEVPPCPYCGSGDTHLENLFGPTACRSVFYCEGCKQPFEAMKPV